MNSTEGIVAFSLHGQGGGALAVYRKRKLPFITALAVFCPLSWVRLLVRAAESSSGLGAK